MKCILAIDQGTTGSRAILYDKKGNKIASAYEEFPQYFPKPGWVEHDPEEIWASVNNSIQKVMSETRDAEVQAIGITNQRETTVIWDRKTGEPVYRAIVWQCRRTAGRCDKLKKDGRIGGFFRESTGLPIDAYFSATKIEWILRNVKDAARRARSGELCFGTTDSWVLWKLTGGREHATDFTNASRTMLFNIEKKEWDKKILHKFRIPERMLPDVKRSSGVFGRTARIGKLPAGIPICGIAGDQQAALFGQACFEPGSIKNTYGTGCFVLLNAGKNKPSTKHGLIITLGCGKKGEPVYVLEGSIFIGGAAVQWLRDGIKIINSAKESKGMSESLTDNEGVYFVPALVGLGAPYWDQNARGALFGITRGTRREHLVRAAVEAMCYQTKDVIDAMRRDTGLSIEQLKIDGGASADDFLCQFQSDILRKKVVRPVVIETTSLGAAYLAGLAVGFWRNTDEIKKCWHVDRVFSPRMKKETAAKFYAAWHNAVKRTLSV
ncbi:MAG TPA: glycerol kinase GlpK [Candidatus Omnitrophota bacterium]|nr:glycerol kinase GlpK [Candidatus Omnitrophota bacterium]HPS19588.1 glycerol kinase GlpK [Candidatus Omnitrophota bacterium]